MFINIFVYQYICLSIYFIKRTTLSFKYNYYHPGAACCRNSKENCSPRITANFASPTAGYVWLRRRLDGDNPPDFSWFHSQR